MFVVEVAEKLGCPGGDVDGTGGGQHGSRLPVDVETLCCDADGGKTCCSSKACRSVEKNVVHGVDDDGGPREPDVVDKHEGRGKDERDAEEMDAHVAAVHVVGLVVCQLVR